MTSAETGPARVTWPKMPFASSAAWPRNTSRARSLVDEYALAERVEVDTHDLGNERALHDARRALAHRAKPLVLLLERLEAQELQAEHEVVRGKLDVAGLDARLGRERFPHRAPGRDRSLHGPLDGIGERRDAVADCSEMMIAVVGDHEAGGHEGEDDEAQPQRGAAEQEGPGIRVV